MAVIISISSSLFIQKYSPILEKIFSVNNLKLLSIKLFQYKAVILLPSEAAKLGIVLIIG